jgi:hypothetical protein
LNAGTCSGLVARTELTVAAALQRFFVRTKSDAPAFRKDPLNFTMRPRYNVHANKFPNPSSSGRTGIRGSLYRPDVTPNKNGDIARTDVFFSDQLDVRGLHHSVGRLNGSDESLGFDHAQSF